MSYVELCTVCKNESRDIFLPNKFSLLKLLITQLMRWFKLRQSLMTLFLLAIFHIEGYSIPYRFDTNTNGAGVRIYIKGSISNKILNKHVLPGYTVTAFIEFNFCESKSSVFFIVSINIWMITVAMNVDLLGIKTILPVRFLDTEAEESEIFLTNSYISKILQGYFKRSFFEKFCKTELY